MFIPRSVTRRQKQSQTIPNSSKNTADIQVNNNLEQSALQPQKPGSMETLSDATNREAKCGLGLLTVSHGSRSQHKGNESFPENKGTGLVTQSETEPRDSDDSDNSDEPVLSFSKQQRWPAPGEPVCVVCGRYGAYIVDRTDDDICSLECKAKRLMKLGIHLTSTQQDKDSVDQQEIEDGDTSWVYREHPEVTSLTTAQCNALYRLVYLAYRSYLHL